MMRRVDAAIFGAHRCGGSGLRAVALGGAAAVLLLAASSPAAAQGHDEQAYESRGSENMEVLSHVPLGPRLSVSDIVVEQELDRPFAYVGRMQYGQQGPKGTDIVSLADPDDAEVIYRWRIENQELHEPTGGMDPKYFKWDGRYYVVQSLQFGQGGPNTDLGAVILDVTSLPDTSGVEEAARIRAPDYPGGFHNIFVYKHSNGRVYLFATLNGPYAHVYDLGTAVEGDGGESLAARVPVPQDQAGGYSGYHDFYVGYHPQTGTDRFYGGGAGGYYVYDVSNIPTPEQRGARPDTASPVQDFELLASLTGISGVRWGHTFTPGPRGRYAVGETEYRYAPLRIFDMQPALDGEAENISSPIAAWTADWEGLPHNHEVRWPLVFVSHYLQGVQVFTLADPENPRTVGWYDTYLGPPNTDRYSQFNGAFGVDVRNEDGLIVVSDMSTGFWVFRMEGFEGWDGEAHGVPDISSAQHWDGVPGGGN